MAASSSGSKSDPQPPRRDRRMTRPASQRVLIQGPTGSIEAVLAVPDAEPAGVAVIAHPHPLFGGTMDNKVVQTLAKAFLELGLAAVRFNFRGVGASEGRFDEGQGETEDAAAVAQWARGQVPRGRLVLAGFSFGAAVQARVAHRIEPDRLVLVAPAVTRLEMPPVPERTLVIHGELDDVVPLKDALDWARPQELPIVLIPGGEHFFHGRLNLLKRLVVDACRF